MKNLLITGGLGGIGSSIGKFAHKHFQSMYRVILLDNLNNGYLYNGEIDGKNYAPICFADVRDTESLYKIIKNYNIDSILHLAAITSLPECEKNPAECFDVNVGGTISVLEAARRAGIKDNVIFSSTSAVYENNSSSPSKEDDDVKPTLTYSLSKKLAEDVCLSYVEKYGMNIYILRYFNVFGPDQDIKRTSPPLINYIVREILDGKMVYLHSNGEQKRDYVHISDVICLTLMATHYSGNERIFNICSGKTLSVNEIYEIISKYLKYDVKPTFRDSQKLWDSYNLDKVDKYPLKQDIIKKEVNKFCLGTNERVQRVFGHKIDDNLESLIKDTVFKIKENYVGISNSTNGK